MSCRSTAALTQIVNELHSDAAKQLASSDANDHNEEEEWRPEPGL